MEEKGHYNLVIEKTKQLIGKVDGNDISDLWYIIDDWNDETNDLDILLDELSLIRNAMHCEHGCDHGSMHNWKFSSEISQELIENYENGEYKGTEKDLDILINLIVKYSTYIKIELGIGNYYGSVSIIKENNKFFLAIDCEVNPAERLEISENIFNELKKTIKL